MKDWLLNAASHGGFYLEMPEIDETEQSVISAIIHVDVPPSSMQSSVRGRSKQDESTRSPLWDTVSHLNALEPGAPS